MALGPWFAKTKCGMCGQHPQGHRMFEAIEGAFIAGDDIGAIAKEYNIPESEANEVVRLGIKRRIKRQSRKRFFKELAK